MSRDGCYFGLTPVRGLIVERAFVDLSPDSLSVTIRQARKARQVTLVELAHLIQVSYSTLARLETGGIPDPHPTLLHKISQGLRIDYMALMGLAGYVQPLSEGLTVPSISLSLSQWPYPTPADCWAHVMTSQTRLSYPVAQAIWAIVLTDPCPDWGLQTGDTLWMGRNGTSGHRAVGMDMHRVDWDTCLDRLIFPPPFYSPVGQAPLSPHMRPMGCLLGMTDGSSCGRHDGVCGVMA